MSLDFERRLTRDWDATTERQQNDAYGAQLFSNVSDSDREIVSRVAGIAEKRGVPRAQVAIAWLLHQPVITAPVVRERPSDFLFNGILRPAWAYRLELGLIGLLYTMSPLSAKTMASSPADRISNGARLPTMRLSNRKTSAITMRSPMG